MSLREAPTFPPQEALSRSHPVDVAKRAQQPDWSNFELIEGDEIKEDQIQKLNKILGKDGAEVQLAEINLAWPYSQISDRTKARPNDLRRAIFRSMLSFGLDLTKKKNEEPQNIDNHGCRREIVVYESSLFPGLFVSSTQLVSNFSPDHNLVVVTSWKAVFKEPKRGLVQELVARLNAIIPIS